MAPSVPHGRGITEPKTKEHRVTTGRVEKTNSNPSNGKKDAPMGQNPAIALIDGTYASNPREALRLPVSKDITDDHFDMVIRNSLARAAKRARYFAQQCEYLEANWALVRKHGKMQAAKIEAMIEQIFQKQLKLGLEMMEKVKEAEEDEMDAVKRAELAKLKEKREELLQ